MQFNKIGVALLASAMYFSIAMWLERSYVGRPEPRGRTVVPMRRPFEPLGGQAYHYLPNARSKHNSLMAFAEDPTNTTADRQLSSTRTVIRSGRRSFGNISKVGLGHFAHWTDQWLFSTSDGGIPTTMGGVTGS